MYRNKNHILIWSTFALFIIGEAGLWLGEFLPSPFTSLFLYASVGFGLVTIFAVKRWLRVVPIIIIALAVFTILFAQAASAGLSGNSIGWFF